jgi:hypothetical protein
MRSAPLLIEISCSLKSAGDRDQDARSDKTRNQIADPLPLKSSTVTIRAMPLSVKLKVATIPPGRKNEKRRGARVKIKGPPGGGPVRNGRKRSSRAKLTRFQPGQASVVRLPSGGGAPAILNTASIRYLCRTELESSSGSIHKGA